MNTPFSEVLTRNLTLDEIMHFSQPCEQLKHHEDSLQEAADTLKRVSEELGKVFNTDEVEEVVDFLQEVSKECPGWKLRAGKMATLLQKVMDGTQSNLWELESVTDDAIGLLSS